MTINKAELLEKIEEAIKDAKNFGIPQFVMGMNHAKDIINKMEESK